MTYREKYSQCKTWQGKVRVMYLYHVLKSSRAWKLEDTARYFNVSTGLASENLRLARNMDRVKRIISRKKALKVLKAS